MADIYLTSTAFEDGAPIPRRYSAEGENLSPPLAWEGLPEGTRQLALIVDDPDAPGDEPFVHWVLYGIPATADGLPQGVPADRTLSSPDGAMQGRNSTDRIGWFGPRPPHGPRHRYYVKLYALGKELDATPGLTKPELLERIEGSVLGTAELVGTYQR